MVAWIDMAKRRMKFTSIILLAAVSIQRVHPAKSAIWKLTSNF